jgi:outer membrane immunogenic protein
MRLALLAAAAAALLPASARAQDQTDWSGFHVGGSVGWAAVDSEIGEDTIGPPTVVETRSDIGEDGWSLGLLGGYNWQFANNIVIGGEADISYVDASTSAQPLIDQNPAGAVIPNNSFGGDVQWVGSVRMRAGYSFGRWMPYVTAGWAFAQYETTSDYASLTEYSRDDTWDAPVYGVGLEYMAHGPWSLRGEYRTADYESESDQFPTFPAFQETRDLSIDEFRLSFVYNR